MKRILQGVVLAGAMVVLAGCDSGPTSKARIALEQRMNDPQSAQYRNEEVKPWGVVCGEVNVKNRMGGYIGFTGYVAFPRGGDEWKTIILDNDTSYEVNMLCKSSPAEILKSEMLVGEGKRGWYVQIISPEEYNGPTPVADVDRLTKLGYPLTISKASGKAYLGPFKNKKSAIAVGLSMESITSMQWMNSEWIF
ncbi:hypothetical protein [Pseudomonas fluorescens]|nr:hypothetical protein [Pseudomonas fluorescens]